MNITNIKTPESLMEVLQELSLFQKKIFKFFKSFLDAFIRYARGHDFATNKSYLFY